MANPIVIVGLGPVGTTLAGLLGKRGHDVIGFDRELAVFDLPRAAHIDHTALRSLQEIGCLDDLLPEMIPNPGVSFVTADGDELASIPGDQGSISGLPASMYFHQPGFDRTLRSTVGAMPTVELYPATEVTALDARGDGVSVGVRTVDGEVRELEASHVIGADGASGPVRSWLGIAVEDLGFEERWIVVDLKLTGPVPTLPGKAVTRADPARPLGMVPMPGGRFRFELMLMEGEDPVAMQRPESIWPLIETWVPPGAATLERAAVYTFKGLVAERWREGRVLLAGDAAHLMPPFLGQGMNTGMRDAANLAWKLDLVARGTASEALLDTYGEERIPNVRAVVEAAVRIGEVVCTLDPEAAARRNERFLADPGSAYAELGFKLPNLPPGPLVLERGGRVAVQPIDASGRRFDDQIEAGFLVLAREPAALQGSGAYWSSGVGANVVLASEFPEFESELIAWLDRIEADVAVVRPDHYVLGAGAGLDAITAAVRGGPLDPQQVSA